MITINATPVLNRVILDANNTVISLTSTNGAGHYFRAIIYIDGVLFDTQSWSRKNAFTTEKNLKKLYNAYFESVFNENFTSGITEQTHLKKRVNITIQELLMADDSVVDVISLPAFYILYNAKPIAFADTVKVAFLGMPADKILLPANGKISVPIYSNTSAEAVVVTLKDNFNNVINTVTVPSDTDKLVHLYNYNLAEATLAANTIYFILTVTVGSTTITQAFRYLQFPDYPVKEIAYLNNFGYFVYAYLDGQMNIDNSVSIENYDQEDGTEKIIEINEDLNYTINSGSLLSSEKGLLTEIVNSLQSKLFYDGEWIDMVTRTKKVKEFQDRANNYSENLQFGVKRNASIDNSFGEEVVESEVPTDSSEPAPSETPISSEPAGSEAPPESETPPEVARVTLDSIVVSAFSPGEGESCLDVSITLDAGYAPTNVIIVVTPDGESPVEMLVAVDDPILLCSFIPGDYSITIKEVGTGLLSNTIFYTIP